MSVALDIGSTEFRSLRRQANRFIARRVPAVYCVFDDSKAQRRLIEQLHLPYSLAEGTLLVLGHAAVEISRTLDHPLVPVIANGQLPYHDPIGRQVCATLIESLIPITNEHSLCLANLPVATTHERNDAGLIDHVIRLRGYQFARLHPARAVILSELQDEGYSGIGVTIGAESVTMAVTHLGQTRFSESYAHGARSIEERFAKARHKYQWDKQGNKYLDLQTVRDLQRHLTSSVINPTNGDEQFLAEAYHRLLTNAFSAMLPEMLRCVKNENSRKALPIVISGGPTRLPGFSQLLQHTFEASGLPCKIAKIRLANNDPYTVCRGLMIEATLQSQPLGEAAVA